MRLPSRETSEESLPPEVRELALNFNAEAKDLNKLLNRGLTFGDNFAVRVYEAVTLDVSDTWLPLSLINGWSNNGEATFVPSIKKLNDGRVVTRGVLKGGTYGEKAAELPFLYRPSALVICIVASNNGGTEVMGQMRIDGNGLLVPQAGGTDFIGLDGISYQAGDGTPVYADCWPVDLLWPYVDRATWVDLVECREVSTNSPVVAGRPDWDMATKSGRQFVRIRNVPGLAPGHKYLLRFMAFSG